MSEPRACAYCNGPIPDTMRRDAVCCSKRCRQARHRFHVAVGQAQRFAPGKPLTLAYADPPYPGKSRKYYGQHPDYAGEVDHAALVDQLAEFDGWALSTSAQALQQILALCPSNVRVAAWHRGARETASKGPLNAWEPVIFSGGRPALAAEPSATVLHDASRPPGALRVVTSSTRQATPSSLPRVDSLVLAAKPRLTDSNRVIGAKPPAFSRWVFDLLGAAPGDHFTDLFPGSGSVATAWRIFTSEERQALPEDPRDASRPAAQHA